jgi:NAD+ diphosphatase
MVAFSARFVGGALRLEEEELEDARWFRYDALPELPPPISLSRRVIDAWAEERRKRLVEEGCKGSG